MKTTYSGCRKKVPRQHEDEDHEVHNMGTETVTKETTSMNE